MRDRATGAEVRRIRAVVVDDSPEQRRMVEFMLMSRGIDVAGTASDGDSALDVITEIEPDIVVSDYQMPHRDGHDLVGALRMHVKFCALPVLIVTGSDDERVESMRRMDLVTVLAKPVTASDLSEAVDNLLAAAADDDAVVELVGKAVRPVS